ncbi:carbohydrate ABC transporter substrate-binding protein, partial [Catellatospora sp. NPDC049609]
MRSAQAGASRRRRFAAVAAPILAAALVLGTAACGGSDDPGTTGGKVKLTIATFGEFGYKELYKEYQQLNPNVEITERITKAEDHHKNLAAHLATNTGAADIEAIEEGWAGQFTANPGKFYNWA